MPPEVHADFETSMKGNKGKGKGKMKGKMVMLEIAGGSSGLGHIKSVKKKGKKKKGVSVRNSQNSSSWDMGSSSESDGQQESSSMAAH